MSKVSKTMKRWHLLGTLCLLTLAAGSGCGDELRRTQSNDIFLDNNTLVFSRVRVGQSEAKLIEIRQGGETDLTVKEIYLVPRPELTEDESPDDLPAKACESTDTTYLDCDRVKLGLGPNQPFPAAIDNLCQFVVDERPELPFTLGSDEFKNVVIRYRAMEATPPGPAMLVIKSNALDKECLTVDMEVQLAAPRISATETTVAFAGGNVPQDTSVLVKNIGTGDLNVQPYTLALETPPATDPNTGDPIAEFRIEVDNDFPWIIPEGGSENLKIIYEPVDDSTDRATLSFRSNDEQTPVFTITLTSEPVFGVLNVAPNPVVFGVPAAGGQVEKVVTLTNSGLKKVDVLGMIIDQPASDYSLGGQQTSFQLAGGASREVNVIYKPQTAQGSNGTLVINSNADNADANGEILVSLTPDGMSLPALLSIDPVSVDFSDVAAGMSKTVTLTLSNLGGAPLEASSIALSGAGGGEVPPTDPEFELTRGGGMTTIAPNGTHEVDVTFTRPAGDRNLHVGALVIESNAGSSPDVIYFTANAPNE